MNKVKICGLKSKEMVDAAIGAGADHIGFVHYEKSPRHLPLDVIENLINDVPESVTSWIVLANPSVALLERIPMQIPSLGGVQVHGPFPMASINHYRTAFPTLKLMKAFSVAEVDDIPDTEEIAPYDYVLFDAKPKPHDKLPGGNGSRFDWSVLTGVELNKAWFLAGGLNAENVNKAMQISGASYVDVSSGVEIAPGVKDIEKIKAFISATKA